MPISVVDTPREGFLPDWVDPVHESDLIERRRAIHMTPEVGWCEFLSTARAAEVLSGLGFEVKVGREILQPDYVRGRDPEEAQHAELTNAVKLLDKYSPEKSGFLKPLADSRHCPLIYIAGAGPSLNHMGSACPVKGNLLPRRKGEDLILIF